jgi:hypothetical protein
VVPMLGREICVIAFIGLGVSSCAYKIGTAERTLPGGYRQLAIPIFINKTQEVGIEVPLTNAIIREFEQSQIAEVVSGSMAPVRLEGTIEDIKYDSRSAATKEPELPTLPTDAVLSTSYQVVIGVVLKLRRTSDGAIIWQGEVRREKVYNSPRIGLPVVNSANALYNQSARRLTNSNLAGEMMEEAHDRMTENF